MMIFGGKVFECSFADKHPPRMVMVSEAPMPAHWQLTEVIEHEKIVVCDALSDKSQLQVDIVWGETEASVAVKGPLPQLSL